MVEIEEHYKDFYIQLQSASREAILHAIASPREDIPSSAADIL